MNFNTANDAAESQLRYVDITFLNRDTQVGLPNKYMKQLLE